MIMLGIIGEYIWRIYDESKKRPLYIIDKYYTLKFTDLQSLLAHLKTDITNPAVKEVLKFNKVLANGTLELPVFLKQWQPIWLSFAIYALIVAVLFAVFFRHKHNPKDLETINH